MRTVKWNDFEKKLTELLNEHDVDSFCDTPDFQLSAFLTSVLRRTGSLVHDREEWHGRRPAHRIDDGFRWYAGSNGEIYQVGPHTSRQDALDAAKEEDWETIYLVNARKMEMSVPYLDVFAERICEEVIEGNHEAFGEDGCEDGWTDAQQQVLAGRLRQTVEQWLKENPLPTWTFGAQRWQEVWVITDESKAAITASWEQYMEAYKTDPASAKLPERIEAQYERVKNDD